MKRELSKIGVSPVIGMILLVGLCVSLAAMAGLVFMDIGGDTTEPIDATYDTNTFAETAEVRLLENSNADKFILRSPDGEEYEINSVGERVVISQDDISDGRYQFIGIIDGNEQVLESIQVGETEYREEERLVFSGHIDAEENDMEIGITNTGEEEVKITEFRVENIESEHNIEYIDNGNGAHNLELEFFADGDDGYYAYNNEMYLPHHGYMDGDESGPNVEASTSVTIIPGETSAEANLYGFNKNLDNVGIGDDDNKDLTVSFITEDEFEVEIPLVLETE